MLKPNFFLYAAISSLLRASFAAFSSSVSSTSPGRIVLPPPNWKGNKRILKDEPKNSKKCALVNENLDKILKYQTSTYVLMKSIRIQLHYYWRIPFQVAFTWVIINEVADENFRSCRRNFISTCWMQSLSAWYCICFIHNVHLLLNPLAYMIQYFFE